MFRLGALLFLLGMLPSSGQYLLTRWSGREHARLALRAGEPVELELEPGLSPVRLILRRRFTGVSLLPTLVAALSRDDVLVWEREVHPTPRPASGRGARTLTVEEIELHTFDVEQAGRHELIVHAPGLSGESSSDGETELVVRSQVRPMHLGLAGAGLGLSLLGFGVGALGVLRLFRAARRSGRRAPQ